MTSSDLYDLGRETLVLVLLLSLPLLGAALLSGVFTGILTSYTKLSDPAIGVVARVVAVLVALLVFSPWLGQSIVAYTHETWSLIQRVSL